MRKAVRQTVVCWAALLFVACWGAVRAPLPLIAAPAAPAPLTLMDIHGKPFAPMAPHGDAPHVFFLLSRTCPLCNEYAPEIGRICDTYAPRGVAFSVVYTDAGLTPAQARQHYGSHRFTCQGLLDPGHRLSARLGATVTPEAAVVGTDGQVLYRGRIDNRLLSWGVTHDPNVADLTAALDAIQQGKPVARPWHAAIGCAIPQMTASRSAR